MIPTKQAIPMTLVSNYTVMIHFALEVYALWATSKHIPFNLQSSKISNVCPMSEPAVAQRIYPGDKVPLMAIVPFGLIALGGSLRIICHRYLGKMFTWETSILKDHRLVTSGPYGIVRHPAYTGYLSVLIGYIWFLWMPGTFTRECILGSSFPPSLTTKNILGVSYALTYMLLYTDTIIFLIRRSFLEDSMLRQQFRKEWDDWARRVRWNVIPYLV